MYVFQAEPNGSPHPIAQKTLTQNVATVLGPTNTQSGGSNAAKQGIIVQSIAANTSKIYVGDSTVSATSGVELAAGDSVFIPIGDVAKIFGFTAGTGQILTGLWV